jgi:hypothetical protein
MIRTAYGLATRGPLNTEEDGIQETNTPLSSQARKVEDG